MSVGEVACSYAALILHEDGIGITADKIVALLKTAKVEVDSYWPTLFAKLAEKKNLGDLIANAAGGGAPAAVAVAPVAASGGGAAAAAPAAEEKKKEEPEEESDDDMGFGLFD
ncbi:60S acidic ribosomal protein P1-3 [Cajanus cajan]|uniref:60S acidic ribosomal protein P1-3 n=1 Tax=Cajanus cajan TaxID=3821 RepID=A0A151TYE0_CAJCA|nr:60S acidic ribosomal protein P1-3 [Cajanus cajan]KYP71994.1 60S acidic ribosomal protein P1-3 [Cajanus cajan]